MTNLSCDECRGSVLYHREKKESICSKCDKKIDVIIQNEEKPENYDISEEENNEICQNMNETKPNNNTKTRDDASKKIGELLLQGWCMKETSCNVCFMPHMKSRQGELICVICGPVNKPKESKNEELNKEKINQKNKETDGFYQISSSKTSTIEEKKQNIPEESSDIKFQKPQMKPNLNENTKSFENLDNQKKDAKFIKTVEISTASPDSQKTDEKNENIQNSDKIENELASKITNTNTCYNSNMPQVLNKCYEKIAQIELKR